VKELEHTSEAAPGDRRHGIQILLASPLLEQVFFILVAIWALLIFSAWPLATVLTADYAVVPLTGIGEAAFSTVTSWMPLAAETARGNLFPATPSLGQGAVSFGFYPYITLWIHGLTIAVFGLKGAAIIGAAVWPTATFLLMVVLFRRFLPRRWAFTLAAVGSIAFSDLPLRDFLFGIAQGVGWQELGVAVAPDLADFPIPSLTLTLFLITLLLSLDRRRLSVRRLTFITILWALQSQVHPVNAAVGLIFWFTHFPFELARQNRGMKISQLLPQYGFQAILALLIAMPAILGWYDLSKVSLDFLGHGHTMPVGLFGSYYYFAYFLLPLGLMALLYVVTRLDYYELVTRFRPIYALMAVEFLLVSFNLITGRGIPAENLFSRLALHVLHPLYYVPFVHFLTRLDIAGPAGSFSLGAEASNLSRVVRQSLHWITMEASKVYLPLLLLVLTAYAFASAQTYWREVEKVQSTLEVRATIVAAAAISDAGEGTVIATKQPSANLLLPLLGQYGSLWVSRFANNVARGDIVARLALYARLSGWSESDFQQFMAPNELRQLTPIHLDDKRVPLSIGYWLGFHREVLRGDAELASHRKKMSDAFAGVDLNADACRFGLSRWLSKTAPPADLMVQKTRETAHGRLYILAWDSLSKTSSHCPKGRK